MRSLQSRIVALFVVLMLAVQGGGFLLTSAAGVAGARQTVADELATGERIFLRVLDQSAQRLVQGARVLSADFAFREAISTADRETIASVLRNHGERIDAAYMTLIGLDRRVIADTFDTAAEGRPFAFQRLIAPSATARPWRWWAWARISTRSSWCRCWRPCRSRGSPWASP